MGALVRGPYEDDMEALKEVGVCLFCFVCFVC